MHFHPQCLDMVHLPSNPVDVATLRVQVLEDLSLGIVPRLPDNMLSSLLSSSVSIFGSFNLMGVVLVSQHIVGFETLTFLRNGGL